MEIVRAGVERTEEMLAFQRKCAAEGSEWEIESERRGLFDECALEIAWAEEHAIALVS